MKYFVLEKEKKLNFNPSPKSNQVFNPSKLKHDK